MHIYWLCTLLLPSTTQSPSQSRIIHNVSYTYK